MRGHNIAWWKPQSLIGRVRVVVAESRALLLGGGFGMRVALFGVVCILCVVRGVLRPLVLCLDGVCGELVARVFAFLMEILLLLFKRGAFAYERA
ncbi:hypothetical protein [Bartonella machadoae]|uniref:hypothetical protein n=1 Tax=Bartonella machadoae TaxID=2893471 RepID=UPI001F4CE80A|nr:hypothetical protein [Bartonella machadoae]UNE53984.1 hypothetical protein LNM86_10505 [Bartonella machadoae]